MCPFPHAKIGEKKHASYNKPKQKASQQITFLLGGHRSNLLVMNYIYVSKIYSPRDVRFRTNWSISS